MLTPIPLLLMLCSPLLVLFADPVLDYLDATVNQLLNPEEYARQVLSFQAKAVGGAH